MWRSLLEIEDVEFLVGNGDGKDGRNILCFSLISLFLFLNLDPDAL